MPFRVLVLIGACIVMILGASKSSAQDNPVVVMETSLGDITIELFQAQAPISVENFLEYVIVKTHKRLQQRLILNTLIGR